MPRSAQSQRWEVSTRETAQSGTRLRRMPGSCGPLQWSREKGWEWRVLGDLEPGDSKSWDPFLCLTRDSPRRVDAHHDSHGTSHISSDDVPPCVIEGDLLCRTAQGDYLEKRNVVPPQRWWPCAETLPRLILQGSKARAVLVLPPGFAPQYSDIRQGLAGRWSLPSLVVLTAKQPNYKQLGKLLSVGRCRGRGATT